jgi:hypothetical protein
MTSELVQRKEEVTASPHSDVPDCLCCFHFAIPIEDLPEHSYGRRARQAKRKKHTVHATTN